MSKVSIWVVMDGDYDGDWIIAVYDSEIMANDHVERTGTGRVEMADVLSALSVDVAAIDPVVARLQREALAETARASYAQEQVWQREQTARIEAATIHDYGDHAALCHCCVFSTNTHFITAHGYCRYCGGWTPEVFRARFGDDGLAKAIDLLTQHDRVMLRQLTGLAL